MKAAYINQTGPASSIIYGDLPDPVPGPGEVLVKVGAVAVNPIDTYIRAGAVAMATQFPYVIGCDLAGTVVACGPETKRFQVGDRVWGSNQSLFGRQGTFAELAAVHEDWLYPTPSNQTDAQAAAGALVGITAHLGLFVHAVLRPGETVFVNGGTGGVGSAVIQLAKAHGARVIATAGSEGKRNYCLKLGADAALDYRDPTLGEQIKQHAAATNGVQVWFETQREPTFDRTVPLMAPRGRVVLMAGRAARPEFPVGPFYVRELRLVGFAMFNSSPAEQREAAMALNHLWNTRRWRPQIGETLPLSAAAQAHQLQEDNTLNKQGSLSGKIVLVPDGHKA